MRHTTRRDFLAVTASTFGAVPLLRLSDRRWQRPNASAVFRHGVASGDPLADRVILWTRVTASRADASEVRWAMATDPAMTRVVARGEGRTGAARDFTVKVDVTGLMPATTYYYRFDAEGERSPVGRTRTLPRGATSRVRLGVVSCSNYPFGYFNAYAALAARTDLDAIVHLGDYIYEYANGTYGDGTKYGRVAAPDKEMVALADYRQRHAQYKADPDSQDVHRQHPFIVVWDDHEFTNNTWRGGAENHDPDRGEGEWFQRRDAAVQAFYEWMPIREDAQALSPRIYRTLRIGDLADLILLDTRLVGRDEQPSRDDVAAIESPERSLLGPAQESWLYGELAESKRAGQRWQILGQQVMFAPQTAPGKPAGNPDSWDGYRGARDRVFDMVERLGIDSFAVLTGDVHSNWAFDLPRRPLDGFDPATGRGSLGIELAGTSVTSPSNVGAGPDGAQRLAELRAARPHLHYVDGRFRGYYVLDVTHARLQADFFAVRTIETRSRDQRFLKGYATPAGRMHLTEQSAPAAAMPSAPDPAPSADW
jgi:alkaline phosphatase D